VNVSRKSALFLASLTVTPIMFAQSVNGLWGAVFIMGMCTASHQWFSSNLYTLVSDTFPRRAVGSVAGLGGTCGYVGATIFQIIVGYAVEGHHNYIGPFVTAGLAYLLAFAIIHLLMPRLEPAAIDAPAEAGAFPAAPAR
jgi:ACS family hexuronate transporter-like MFS transporter